MNTLWESCINRWCVSCWPLAAGFLSPEHGLKTIFKEESHQ